MQVSNPVGDGKLNAQTRADLTRQAQSGDLDAMEALLRDGTAKSYRLAYGLLGSQADAEDALQEASVRAWRRIANVRPGADFLPWFFSIMVRECQRISKRKWSSVDKVASIEGSSAPEPTDARHDLRVAIASLPFDQRAVVMLHYYADMELKDVAAALDVPVGTVKSRLARSLDKLRPMLEVAE